jgi:hypothetical protein
MVERRDLLAALALGPIAGAVGASAGRGEEPTGASQIAARALADAIVDIRLTGARSDGVTDDADAVARAASEGSVLFPRGVSRIGRDLVIRARAHLAQGAIVSPASGVTITFAGGLDAPLTRVFAGEGAVVLDPAIQPVGQPEWWGAVANDADVDCAAAINACIRSCAVTQLQQAHYHIRQSIEIRGAGKTLRGVNAADDPGTPSTQIVVEDAAITGIVCGTDTRTKSPTTDDLTLESFTVSRARRVATPGQDPRLAPTGVKFLWCALLHATRVTVREHAVGFSIYGCAECYFTQCSAIRIGAGAEIANDIVSGFFLDYSAASGYAGGNASMYFERCRAFTSGRVPFPYSAGLTTFGGFVDLFISRFETGFKLFGIDLRGDGTSAESFATQDCLIRDCVLDSNAAAGIRIRGAGSHCDVHVSGCYIALAEGFTSAACVMLGGGEAATDGLGGAVTVCDCEFIGDYAGVIATNVAVCNLASNTHLNLQQPVTFTRVGFSEVRDTVRITRLPAPTFPVVSLSECEGVTVGVSASGVADAFRCGVFVDPGSSRIEVNCTRLDASTVGGAHNLIVSGGAPWGGGATFGNRNVVSGAI